MNRWRRLGLMGVSGLGVMVREGEREEEDDGDGLGFRV
jgi:hypothetical protein